MLLHMRQSFHYITEIHFCLQEDGQGVRVLADVGADKTGFLWVCGFVTEISVVVVFRDKKNQSFTVVSFGSIRQCL